jgi:DNA-binding transcriptional LysR family regulator
VAGGPGETVTSQHALSLEAMHAQIAVLEVEGLPIRRSWYVAHSGNKQLSVAARTFLEYLENEAPQLLSLGLQSEPKPKRAARA